MEIEKGPDFGGFGGDFDRVKVRWHGCGVAVGKRFSHVWKWVQFW